MPKVISNCENCGQQIENYPSRQRRWCSQKCRAASNGMPRKPKTGQMRPCPLCGTEFWVEKSQAESRKFCSVGCLAESQKSRVVLRCAHCGRDFEVRTSQAGLKYCSRDCMAAARIRRPLDREHNGKPARLDDDGYVWVWAPEHSESKRYKGWMAEHRLIAEQAIGRPLTSADEVHHVNRIKHDNRPENLQVLDGVTHANLTAQQRLSDREMVAEYMKRFGPLP